MRKTRKTNLRSPKKLIILICEGSKTEINYFQSIFNSNSQNLRFYSLKCYQPQDYSPLGIVNQCIFEIDNAKINKIKKSDFSVWAIFDRDNHSGLEMSFQKAKSKNIKIIYSSICFEYWILLHYSRTTRPFYNCNELINYIKTNYNSDFEKRNNLFIELEENIEVAILNGKWLVEQVMNVNPNSEIYELNPYTNAHELVEYLTNLNN